MKLSIEKIEPNKFNPNVMSEEEYNGLKQDMLQHGPDHEVAIDPITVVPKNVFYNDPEASSDCYVIVNGEHRWKAAKELGWTSIPCEVRMIGESVAMVINYLKNKERGHIDPWKEALLFKREVDRGLNHETIAAAYNVDRTTVTKRLSLLNITGDTKKILADVPRGTLQTSHFEVLAPLNSEVQERTAKKILSELTYHMNVPVSEVSRMSKIVKNEMEMERKLKKALEGVEFPNCPQCKNFAVEIAYNGIPWVQCRNYHHWNSKTGKMYNADIGTERAERSDVPGTVRSFYTMKEINEALVKRILEALTKFTDISNISIQGTFESDKCNIDMDLYGSSTHFNIHSGNYGNSVGFRTEKHDYKTGEKTSIHVYATSLEDLKRIQDFIEGIMKGEKLAVPKSLRLKEKEVQ